MLPFTRTYQGELGPCTGNQWYHSAPYYTICLGNHMAYLPCVARQNIIVCYIDFTLTSKIPTVHVITTKKGKKLATQQDTMLGTITYTTQHLHFNPYNNTVRSLQKRITILEMVKVRHRSLVKDSQLELG